MTQHVESAPPFFVPALKSGRGFDDLLEELQHNFIEEFRYTPQLAFELEWQFVGQDEVDDTALLAAIMLGCQQQEIVIHGMSHEEGDRQYEIALEVAEPVQACEELLALKRLIQSCAKAANQRAVFAIPAVPLSDYPSGLHAHVSVLDQDGKNLFAKVEGQEQESEMLQHGAAGILALFPSMTYVCNSHEADYARYGVGEYLRQSPSHVCWSGNNRTAMLRVPTSTLHPDNRHLEFRGSSADANPFAVAYVLFSGIWQGIARRLMPPEKTFGNAFDEQYNLPKLPRTLGQAKLLYDEFLERSA